MPTRRRNTALASEGTYVQRLERALNTVHENARKAATAMNTYRSRSEYLARLSPAVLEVARVFRAARWNEAAVQAHEDVLKDAWLVATTNVDAAAARSGVTEQQERRTFRALERSTKVLLEMVPTLEADLAEMRRRMR